MWNFFDHHPVSAFFIVAAIAACLVDISRNISNTIKRK